MAAKVSNLSDLIHRVASTCLTHPLAQCHRQEDGGEDEAEEEIEEEEDEGGEGIGRFRVLEEGEGNGIGSLERERTRAREMGGLMEEVFQSVASVKRAYVSLQEAHCPWDPDKMSAADMAVVAELRRLGRLRDRFRRGSSGGGSVGVWTANAVPPPLREAVAPYEAALEEVRRELKAKEAEVDSLKEKLRGATTPSAVRASGRKGRFHQDHHSSNRVCRSSGLGAPAGKPTPELFETYMEQVKSASKSFTAYLLSLMRCANWDIAAAVRSIIEAGGNDYSVIDHPATPVPIPTVGSHHAKHALESYVNRKLFHGFENETFYMEGSLSSLLNPDQYRRDCYAQFLDMRAMDPAELLGVLPTCHFGKFAGKKYLSMVHPKMEESLFGGVDQRRQVAAGAHPRTGFYGEYLRLAKAVWLLHLLAFALDPAPSHFEASKGAEFHPAYMESVVRFAGGRIPAGWAVGFPVGPGFKLGNGSVVRARVFLVAME